MSHDPNLCGQEPRLAVMENVLEGINENLAELRQLMLAVTQSQERIASLRASTQDQEDRIRKLEHTQAAGKWMERIVWLLVAAALTFYLNFGKG